MSDRRKTGGPEQGDKEAGQTATFHEWPLTLELTGANPRSGFCVRLDELLCAGRLTLLAIASVDMFLRIFWYYACVEQSEFFWLGYHFFRYEIQYMK